MNWQLLKTLATVSIAVLLCSHANGAGWFNMPTSPCQCIGYGYGPGYHAPLVLGSPLASGTEAKRLLRVQRAPISSTCSSFDAPSSLPAIDYPSYEQQVPTLAPGYHIEGYSQNRQPQQLQSPQLGPKPQAATASRQWNLRW